MTVMVDYKHLHGTQRRRAITGYMVAAAQWAVPVLAGGAVALVFTGWLIVVSP